MVANSGAAQVEAVEAALWAALEEQLELTRRLQERAQKRALVTLTEHYATRLAELDARILTLRRVLVPETAPPPRP